MKKGLSKCRGSAVLLVLAVVATMSVMAVIGSSLFMTMHTGNQRSSLRIASAQTLDQSAYALTAEDNLSGGFPISSPALAWSGSPSILPSQGIASSVGLIPSASSAPKKDAWGSNLAYCTYTPAAKIDPVFAIISAGPDRVFQTNCTQAFSNKPQGDDALVTKNVMNIKQGVGGTTYFGQPVANIAALEALPAARIGEARATLDTGSVYVNKTGTPGPGYWSLIGLQIAGASAQPSTLMPKIPSIPVTPSVGGALWTWGGNNSGQIGDGTYNNVTIPKQIGSTLAWSAFGSGGYNISALQTNGSLWTWGDNVSGQLGNGTTTASTTPAQVASATNWAFVSRSAMATLSLAIKSDGTMWGAGSNTFLNSATFTQIGSANNWGYVSHNTNGTNDVALAIRSDGTLWAIGDNSMSQFGNGTTTSSATFVQIGTGSNWAQVEVSQHAVAALKTDGTLWVAGNDNWSDGEVAGVAVGGVASSFVQVGTGTNWLKLSAGAVHFLALKNDGTLWGWGLGDGLGQGAGSSGAAYPTPVQIGTGTSWKKISAGDWWSVALKSDGTVWTCGYNAYGQLGNGTLTSNYTLQQVGTSTNWKDVIASERTVTARQ